MKKITIVVLAMLALTIGVYAQSAPTPAPTTQTAPQLSPAFKEAAWRATDALDRIGDVDSMFLTDVERKLIIDADKAVDEAKYKAVTTMDKEVLRMLKVSILSEKVAQYISPSDPEVVILFKRYLSCMKAAQYYIEFDNGTQSPYTCTEEGQENK